MMNTISEMIKPYDPALYQDYIKYYANYTSQVHDLNLTNLDIWHESHELHTLEIGGYLYFIYHPDNVFERMISEPVGNYTEINALKDSISELLSLLRAENNPIRFRRISESFKDHLEVFGYTLHITTSEDYYDYCYDLEKLATLSGNAYHKKKNHLNQFRKYYVDRYRIESITPESSNDALTVAQNWCTANGCGDTYDLCYEFAGIKNVLTHWESYATKGLIGSLIYVDDRPVAMSFGERIQNDTFLCHIEKADADITGAYTAINHALVNQVIGQASIVNREQDMGKEGIRKAKQSYHPIELVKKFDVLVE